MKSVSNKAVVVIPVYKDKISDTEELSFRRTLKILCSHDICLVTFSELDCSFYYEISKELQVPILRENFPKEMFAGIKGYNKLMLSFGFYNRFRTYDYILIVQLDAYVFKDELNYWCDKDYDYIGAPCEGLRPGGKEAAVVGNGGFSLRRVAYFCGILWWPFHLLRPLKKVEFDKNAWRSPIIFIKRLLKLLGVHNNIHYFKKNGRAYEDYVISVVLADSLTPPRVPDIREASRFSIEVSPRYYVGLNGGILPFGCHAFLKYDFDFWKQHMDINSVKR